jgi:hypothetical protein
VVSLVLAAAPCVVAQVQQPEPGKDAKPAAERTTKDSFRARLERRLNESRENQKALEDAITKLDNGASQEEVRRSLSDRPGVAARLFGDEEGRDPRFGPGPDGPRPGREHEGDGRPDGRPRDPDRPFSADEQKAVREILAQAYPKMAEEVDKLFAVDPEAAKRKINEVGPRVRFLLDLRERDPEMYTLRLEEVKTAREAVAVARQIAAKHKEGVALTSPELQEPMRRLRDLVVAQLRNRLAVEHRELADLQRRVEQKKQDIDAHSSDNDSIVDRQVNSMLERAEKGKPEADPLRPHPPGHKPEQRPPG